MKRGVCKSIFCEVLHKRLQRLLPSNSEQQKKETDKVAGIECWSSNWVHYVFLCTKRSSVEVAVWGLDGTKGLFMIPPIFLRFEEFYLVWWIGFFVKGGQHVWIYNLYFWGSQFGRARRLGYSVGWVRRDIGVLSTFDSIMISSSTSTRHYVLQRLLARASKVGHTEA